MLLFETKLLFASSCIDQRDLIVTPKIAVEGAMIPRASQS